MQDMSISNIDQKVTPRLKKQYSIRQERREGFAHDNQGICAELKHQPAIQTPVDSAILRQTRIDTHPSGLGGLWIV